MDLNTDKGLTRKMSQSSKAEDKRNSMLKMISFTDLKKDPSKKSLTWKQRGMLLYFALQFFLNFCTLSVIAPFFPKESSMKGMSSSVSGFVFSFYGLVVFLVAPLYGKLLPRFGPKLLMISGLALAGLSCAAFGLIDHIDDLRLYTLACFIIRGLEAVGFASFVSANYVYVIYMFPNHLGFTRGLLETAVGLGLSVGPAIGGFLYTIGGFGLPFYVLGTILLLVSITTLPMLPNLFSEEEKKPGSILKFLKIPAVLIVTLVIIVQAATWSCLDPTLEPHLRTFNFSPQQVGLVFLLMSASYAISSPAFGWLGDKKDLMWSMMIVGCFLNSIFLSMLGPNPFLPAEANSIPVKLIAVVCLGASCAMGLLPTFLGLERSAKAGGCDDSLSTNSIVGGMWSSMYSLGEVVGPSTGGVLLDHYGFATSTSVVALFNLVCSVTILGFVIWTKRSRNAIQPIESNAKNNNNDISIISDGNIAGEAVQITRL